MLKVLIPKATFATELHDVEVGVHVGDGMNVTGVVLVVAVLAPHVTLQR